MCEQTKCLTKMRARHPTSNQIKIRVLVIIYYYQLSIVNWIKSRNKKTSFNWLTVFINQSKSEVDLSESTSKSFDFQFDWVIFFFLVGFEQFHGCFYSKYKLKHFGSDERFYLRMSGFFLYVIILNTITKQQRKLVRNTCDRHICNFGMGSKKRTHTHKHTYTQT